MMNTGKWKILMLVMFTVGVLMGAMAQEQAEDPEEVEERRPVAPHAVDPQADPRWGAPGWGAPGWWDPAMFDIDVAMVRVAHLSPNAPEVDLTIHWPEVWWGEEAPEAPAEEEFEEARSELQGLEYATITDYVMVPAGTHSVWISEPGEEATEAWYQEEINFSAGAYYTLVAAGFVRGIDEELDARIDAAEEDVDVGWLEGIFAARDPEDLSFRLEVYDDEPGNFPDAGWAHVRVINAAPGTPEIDIWAWHTAMREEMEGEPEADPAAAPPPAVAPPATDFHLVTGLAFPNVSDYEAVRALGYELQVRLADTDVVIYEFPGDQLLPGAVYTIFITGTALEEGTQLEAIALADVRLVSMPAEEVEEAEEEPEEEPEEDPDEEPEEEESEEEDEDEQAD